jgi:Flp pilus assembly protein CpaB
VKRRSWIWLIVSVFFAIAAGVVAILALQSAASRQPQATPVPKQQVVVARNPIAANSILRADNVSLQDYDEVPSGAATRVQPVLGMLALRDIAEGEPILMQDLMSPFSIAITRNLEVLLGNDKIAVAYPADDILSQWGAVQAGDHVDVLFTLDVLLETPMKLEDFPTTTDGQYIPLPTRDQSLDQVSVLTLQNLEVLGIIEEPQPEITEQTRQQQNQPATLPRRALILKIDPQDAVVLKYLLNSVGSIDLALRSPTNPTLFDVQPVNINYLVLRYGIVLPQPLE